METDFRVVVIKIGTDVVTKNGGEADFDFMRGAAGQIKKLQENNSELKFIIVSSGAIGCGKQVLNLPNNPAPEQVSLKQVCAATGQLELMNNWQKAFGSVLVSQHLVTHDALNSEEKLGAFKNCLFSAVERGIVPIINENDPICTEEIEKNFRDNDELAALVAMSVGAKKLIILSGVNGFYTKNPQKYDDAELIESVSEIDDEMKKKAHGKSENGRGGMGSKLLAIETIFDSGQKIEVFLTSGKKENCILEVFGEDFSGTRFAN